MVIAIILGTLAVAGIVATIVALRTDGHRQIPTEWSRAGVWEQSNRPADIRRLDQRAARRARAERDARTAPTAVVPIASAGTAPALSVTRSARTDRVARRTRRAAQTSRSAARKGSVVV